MNEISVRKYVPQDLDAVLRLYENCLESTIHLTVDGNFLRYFMTYPGVEREGVLVAERNGETVGFEIISTYRQTHMHAGKIILFAAQDLEGARQLLSAAEDYCLQKNVDLLMAVPPPQLASAFKQRRWDRYIHSAFVAKGIRMAPLLQAILDRKQGLRSTFGTKKIILALDDENIQITKRNKGWQVEEIDTPSDGSPTLIVDKKNLLNSLFGNRNPSLEYLWGHLRIKPRGQAFRVLRFLHRIRMKSSVFTTLADKI